MNEELSQEEDESLQAESSEKKTAHLRPWQFKKGQSGNPAGKKPGTLSLKVFAKNYIQNLTDDEKLEFLEGLNKKDVWEMAEGSAKRETELTGNLTISEVLDQLENGQEASQQKLEDKQPLQDKE